MNLIPFPNNRINKARLDYATNNSLHCLLVWLEVCIYEKTYDTGLADAIKRVKISTDRDIEQVVLFTLDSMFSLITLDFEPERTGSGTCHNRDERPDSIKDAANNIWDALETEADLHRGAVEKLGLHPKLFRNVSLVNDAFLWPVLKNGDSFYSSNPLKIIQEYILEQFPKSIRTELSSHDQKELEQVFSLIQKLATQVKNQSPIKVSDSSLNSNDMIGIFEIWAENNIDMNQWFCDEGYNRLIEASNCKEDIYFKKTLLAIMPRLYEVISNLSLDESSQWHNFLDGYFVYPFV